MLKTSTNFAFAPIVLFMLTSSIVGDDLDEHLIVDETGITIPPEIYFENVDIIIPGPEESPFFFQVMMGLQNGLLVQNDPASHINFDGSAQLNSAVTGPIGTFSWTVQVPAGIMQFADPDPTTTGDIPNAVLYAPAGTLIAVNGPGFDDDPLVGTNGWFTKYALHGPFDILAGTPLNALPDDQFITFAKHGRLNYVNWGNPWIGDVNCDGFINLLDVDPFIEVLSTGEYQVEADINKDGVVNLLDVDPFVKLLGDT